MCRINGDMRKFRHREEDLSRPDFVRRLIYGLLTDQQKKRLETEYSLAPRAASSFAAPDGQHRVTPNWRGIFLKSDSKKADSAVFISRSSWNDDLT